MANAPVIKLKDFGVSTAVFKWEKDGKVSYSISLQRSFKKKDSNEYAHETINLYPEDLLKYAELLRRTYENLVDYRDQQSAPAPQQSAPAPAPVDTTDDIPF